MWQNYIPYRNVVAEIIYNLMHSSKFFYLHLQMTDPFGVSCFYSRLRQFCHWLFKFLQKSQPSQKKINHRQQMYDSSKHSCHSIARPRSPSKLAGVPTQNDHSVAFWIQKIYLCHKQSDKKKTKASYCCPNNPLNLLQSYVCTDM